MSAVPGPVQAEIEGCFGMELPESTGLQYPAGTVIKGLIPTFIDMDKRAIRADESCFQNPVINLFPPLLMNAGIGGEFQGWGQANGRFQLGTGQVLPGRGRQSSIRIILDVIHQMVVKQGQSGAGSVFTAPG